MQIKLLEDLVALADTRSFTRAAERRHVTHPAFGRRIRALEQWAGVPLVERGGGPVRLTTHGERLLEHARQLVRQVDQARTDTRGVLAADTPTVSLATGRTLARTIAADLITRARRELRHTRLVIQTGQMAETVRSLERGDVDFMLAYHHPVVAFRLNAQQYVQKVVAKERLVPVSRLAPGGKVAFSLEPGREWPCLAYADTLALGRLVRDHLEGHPDAPSLRVLIECDSADALLEYALKGLGVAWLPWSLAAGPCAARQLAPVGPRSLQIGFDVRMVRPKRRLHAAAEQFWQALDLD